jgi:hypothetical protein
MKKLVFVFLLAALLFFQSACTSSGETVSAYISAIGTAVNSVIALEAPTWSGAAALKTQFQQVATDAASWQPGTASTDLLQVLNDLGNSADSVPSISPKVDALIGIAVSGVDSVIALVQSESAATSPQLQNAVFEAWLDDGPTINSGRKHAYTGAQFKSKRDFTEAWNKLAPKQAKIKHGIFGLGIL